MNRLSYSELKSRSDIAPEAISAVYLTINGFSGASLAEISAKIPNVSSEDVKAAVTKLVQLGIAYQSQENIDGFSVIEPVVACSKIIQYYTDNSFRNMQDANLIANTIAVEANHVTSADDTGNTKEISGADQVMTNLRRIGAHAEKSIYSLLTRVPSATGLALATSEDADLLARGLQLRIIYPEAARFDNNVQEYLNTVGVPNLSARTSLITPVRLVIADKAEVIILFKSGRESKASITTDPGIVGAFVKFFEEIWNTQSRSFEYNPLEISHRELSVLQCMISRPTDKAIARSLGLSTRTVNRVISDLYLKTGTLSRFALGIEAERRGWLK